MRSKCSAKLCEHRSSLFKYVKFEFNTEESLEFYRNDFDEFIFELLATLNVKKSFINEHDHYLSIQNGSNGYDQISLWNIENQNLISSFDGHNKKITCLMLLPNNRLASSSKDHTIKIWNLDTQNCIRSFDLSKIKMNDFDEDYFKAEVVHLMCYTLSNHLICLSKDGLFFIIDHDFKISSLSGCNAASCLKYHSVRNELFIGYDDGEIRFVGTESIRNLIYTLKFLGEHKQTVNCLETMLNGILISGSEDCSIKIWDLDKQECLRLIFHSSAIMQLKLFDNDSFMAILENQY